MPAVDTSYMLTSIPTGTTYKLPSGDHSKQDTALPFPVRFLKTTQRFPSIIIFFSEYHFKFYNSANIVFNHAM